MKLTAPLPVAQWARSLIRALDLPDLKGEYGNKSMPLAFNDDIGYNVIQHVQGVHR